jgi:hypothetical protein
MLWTLLWVRMTLEQVLLPVSEVTLTVNIPPYSEILALDRKLRDFSLSEPSVPLADKDGSAGPYMQVKGAGLSQLRSISL